MKEQLKYATQFVINMEDYPRIISIERRGKGDKWGVKFGPTVLNKDEQFEIEPVLRSSRSDEFLTRTTFDLDTAFELAWKVYHNFDEMVPL